MRVCVFQVVEQGMFVKHSKVEVYLTELKLCEDGNMDNVVIRPFSKADRIGEFWPLKDIRYSRGVIKSDLEAGLLYHQV